jgi:ferredoxin--NADP+ reductase
MSHKILCKEQLSENVFRIEVEAPLIARARKPGQFVIIGVKDEYSERIPLTIAGAHPDKGTIELIFQRVGKSTAEMADMNEGDSLGYIAGPLGQPTHVEKVGTIVCVGGGIGNAPLLPIATAMKEAGNKVISIIGARDKGLIILEKEFAAISDELIVVTDDGSYGRKGLVTEPLAEICESVKPDLAIVIGPTIMMKFCCKTTEPFGVHTLVSLNTIMVDGTGMCGGCRVEVGGETKFVCVDGPEFDGHKVDFDQMMRRLGAYKVQEQKAHEEYKHKCRFGLKNEE